MRGYERLSELAGHPILTTLLRRIMSDESRHFAFYYAQAEKRLAAPGAARLTRLLLERAWAPVGTGVQPDAEVRFVGGYLFGGDAGQACARAIDRTVRKLPGLDGLPLLERYLRREGLTGPRVFDPREAAPPRADAVGKFLPLGRKPFRLFGKTIAHTRGERPARQRGIFTT
jgi:hypothetical protein